MSLSGEYYNIQRSSQGLLLDNLDVAILAVTCIVISVMSIIFLGNE